MPLPVREEVPRSHWWSDESSHESLPTRSSRRRRAASASSPSINARGHKSRESNRTIDQETFWESLRAPPSGEMSLSELRWADEASGTPNAGPHVDAEPAVTSPPASTPGIMASHRDDASAETPSSHKKGMEPEEAGQESNAGGLAGVDGDGTAGENEVAAEEKEHGERVAEDEREYEKKTLDEGTTSENAEDGKESEKARLDTGTSPENATDEGTKDTPEENGRGDGAAIRIVPSEPEVGDVHAQASKQQTLSSPSRARLEPPQFRRKVSWRNRNVIVSIPNVEFESLGLPIPMTVAEVRARSKNFEESEHYMHKFAPEPGDNIHAATAHVRPIFPGETELRSGSVEPARVNIPDIQKMKEHEARLVEQKLAALGVSQSVEDSSLSQSESMSRRSSGQFRSQTFSPPVSTTSAGSIGRPAAIRSGHSHTMSMASPMSPFNGPFGHARGRSTFVGLGGFVPGQSLQPGLSGPRAFSPRADSPAPSPIPGMQSVSPQRPFAFPNVSQPGPPLQLATGSLRNGVGSFRGPGSPWHRQATVSPAQDLGPKNGQDRPQGQQGYFPSVQPLRHPVATTQASPIPTGQLNALALPKLPEEDDEEDLAAQPDVGAAVSETDAPPPPSAYMPPHKRTLPPHKRAQLNANIATPTPRGHQHNISEGLERDIRATEALARPAKRAHDQVPDDVSKGVAPTQLQAPKAHTVSAEKDPLTQAIAVQESPHSRKKKGPRLDAAAPAFKFNPHADFQPASTSFTFEQPTRVAPAPTQPQLEPPQQPRPPLTVLRGHARQASSGSFNAAAPAFRPMGMPPHVAPACHTAAVSPKETPGFRFGGVGAQTALVSQSADVPSANAASSVKPANLPAMPKSEFNFSAPSFTPGATEFKTSSAAAYQTVAPKFPGIFGDAEIPDIVKPTAKSRAVEIRQPETRRESESDREDSEGRIAQNEDRFKRLRGVAADADEVPRFAEPESEPVARAAGAGEKALQSEASVPGDDAARGSEDEDVRKRGSDTADAAAPRPTHKSEALERQTEEEPARLQTPTAIAEPLQPIASAEAELWTKRVTPDDPTDTNDAEEGEVVHDERSVTSPDRTVAPADGSELKEADPSSASSASLTAPSNLLKASIDLPTHGTPSFDEIDAVMQQLNDVGSAPGSGDALSTISPLPSPGAHPMKGVTYIHGWPRSDAPSPSPRRPLPRPPRDSSSATTRAVANGWPHVQRLNKDEEVPVSDWSDALSPPDVMRLQHRSNFFDSRVDDVVGRVVDQRLQPLEESLRSIQLAVSKRPRSRSLVQRHSSSAVQSDADDEDEDEAMSQRPVSRGRDKRVDQVKAVVLEALREQSPRTPPQSLRELQELHAVLADMKMSFARAASTSLDLDDIRAVVDEVVTTKQLSTVAAVSTPINPTRSGDGASDADDMTRVHNRDYFELETRLDETLARALEETNLRRAAEEREAEHRRKLRLAEDELLVLRGGRRDEDQRRDDAERECEALRTRLHAVQRERQSTEDSLLARVERSEESKQQLVQQVARLEAEYAASYATLEEYRMSSHKWRLDIDQAVRKRDAADRMIEDLESKLQEAREGGHNMRRMLEKLHADMATAAGQLASDKARWHAAEEDYFAKISSLESREAAQASDRHMFEKELAGLRAAADDASGARVMLDQMRTSNSHLEEVVKRLQADLAEKSSAAARWERECNDAHESGRAEVARTRLAMEVDIERANHQVNVVRANYEAELAKLRAEAENGRIETETARARHERYIEDEEHAHREALRKVNHASSVALEEVRQKHDAVVGDMETAHARALKHAHEDRERSEGFLSEKLMLSDAKTQHYQDRVLHLEERLAVARSAAQAAAQNAKAGKAPNAAPSTSTSFVREKISPQALRESILVLQEQLQERESTIETLRAEIDDEAPAKLKQRDDEIAWLRELLSVRSEELGHLIHTLAQPSLDRAAVRDTAIRIRASLQMEQHERERVGHHSGGGGASLPGQAIASLSTIATPKAAQLSSVFHKWRANMESSALKKVPSPSARPSHTPSKAPPAAAAASSRPSSSHHARIPSAYTSGLMTPPASTNMHKTPSPESHASLPPPRLHPSASQPTASRRRASATSVDGSGDFDEDARATSLLRLQSYDRDAHDRRHDVAGFEDGDRDEDLDVADDQPPAGRNLGAELQDLCSDDDVGV